MIFDSLKAYVAKQHPLGTVTWDDVRKLIEEFQSNPLLVSIATSSIKFTKREKDFIHYVANDMGTKEIAKAMNKSVRTVEALRVHIRKKTGVKSNVGLILYAAKAGLLEVKRNEPEVVAETNNIS